MSASRYFSAAYGEARRKFRDAAAATGGALEAIQNPLRGPEGERLITDVLRLGSDDAGKVLFTISATHGVEGYCGSGAQVAWLSEGLWRDLPPDTAAVVVHAINPHGFAWTRRVTEDNVDLNRNFVDHSKPYPTNAGYAELAEAIAPTEWSVAAQAAAQARLDAYKAKHGAMAQQTAISGGQYSYPHGLFFGGHAPTWSRRTLETIMRRHLARARHVAVVDYHTGLGPYGHGELIAVDLPGSPAFERANAWLAGEVTSPAAGTSKSAPLVGTNLDAMARFCPHAGFTSIALEYGTKPLDEVLNALRADCWLHTHGDLASPEAKAIKRRIRDAFYGDKDDWKAAIWARALDINRKMLAGLRGLN